MPLPVGISTTTVTFGTALTNVTRTDLKMRVTFTPTTNLVWAPTGTVIIALGEATSSNNDGNGTIDLIDPWQTGFVNGNGYQVTGWGYTVHAEYLDSAGRVVLTAPDKIITWTAADDGPIDLDLLIPIATQNGITVYLPDSWSADITTLMARVTALETGGGSGNFDTAVAALINTPGTATRAAILALIGAPGGGGGGATADTLLLENGNFFTTESGDVILLDANSTQIVFLTTESGDLMVTESADLITA